MYFGIPVRPTLKNFYAWTPQDDYFPEWLDNYFPNGNCGNYIVYTKDPMKKFLIGSTDYIIRCGIGSEVFFLIIKKGMYENWWQINEQNVSKIQQEGLYQIDKEHLKFYNIDN